MFIPNNIIVISVKNKSCWDVLSNTQDMKLCKPSNQASKCTFLLSNHILLMVFLWFDLIPLRKTIMIIFSHWIGFSVLWLNEWMNTPFYSVPPVSFTTLGSPANCHIHISLTVYLPQGESPVFSVISQILVPLFGLLLFCRF